MGLLVVAADGAHPGWGMAANALGALIGGGIAALIAVFTVRHETEKQKAEAAESRKDELRRSALLAFAASCAEMQLVLLRRNVNVAMSEAVKVDLRCAQVQLLLHAEGRRDLLRWVQRYWGSPYRTLRALHKRTFETRDKADNVIPDEDAKEMSRTLVHLEHECLRWSTLPLEEWSIEPVNVDLIARYSLRADEKGSEPSEVPE